MLIAFLNDSLHVGPFGANYPAGHLEFVLVQNLDIVAAGELNILLLLH